MTDGVLAFLRRRALLVALTAITVAVLAYMIGSLRPITYSADSVLLVPSGGSGTGPGQANEALRLATTYSELIPRDVDVQLAVAAALQQPVTSVRSGLSVQPLGDTALLQVRYVARNRQEALLGSRTAAQSVVEGAATSDTVARGSIRLVGLADDDAVTVTGGVTSSTVPIGLVLGLALGTVLAIAAERANRRVDRATDVRSVLDVPVFELGAATPSQREALLRLWGEPQRTSGLKVIAIMGVDVPYERVLGVCESLAEGMTGVSVAPSSANPASLQSNGTGLVLVPTGAAGSGEPFEEIALSAELVVLVVPFSVRRAAMQRAMGDLLTYASRRPGFVVLTKMPHRSRRARRAARAPNPRHQDSGPGPVVYLPTVAEASPSDPRRSSG